MTEIYVHLQKKSARTCGDRSGVDIATRHLCHNPTVEAAELIHVPPSLWNGAEHASVPGEQLTARADHRAVAAGPTSTAYKTMHD